MTQHYIAKHPLESLQPQEILQVRHVVIEQGMKRHGVDPATTLFISMDLIDPSKEFILSYISSKPFDRRVIVVLVERTSVATYEVIVSLTNDKLVDWTQRYGVHPLIPLEEFSECDRIVKLDPNFREAMKKRGLLNPDHWMIEPWTAGYYGDDEEKALRLLKTLVFTRFDDQDNGYAHPIEGLCVVVDLAKMKVVKIIDNHPHVNVPQRKHNYRQDLWLKQDPKNKMRTDLKPLHVIQPEGPSFKVTNGNHVQWQNWSFFVNFTTREGLVLQNIHFHNRPLIFRASIAEMAVPYGDPSPIHSAKNVFDLGEYGMGRLANSLNPNGCDCLGNNNHYFDAVMSTSSGSSFVIDRAICMHEEDHGMLWKHTDWRLNHVDVRRNRRLSINFVATVGNYEYGFFWYFYLDGAIDLEVKHSGIVNTFVLDPTEKSLLKPKEYPNDEFNANNTPDLKSLVHDTIPMSMQHKYATKLNNEGLHAHIHQHIYCARLDMMIDGIKNTVVEVDVVPEENRKINPRGTAFYVREKVLRTEIEACRDMDLQNSRTWKIINSQKRNHTNEPVAYSLHPGNNVKTYSFRDSFLNKRAPWLRHHLWVTPFSPSEYFPSGDYPNQSDSISGGPGIAHWIKQNRNIQDEDVVIWWTFGITHIVRLEDFPVMPVGPLHAFRLQPHGFFNENPVLDVPPSEELKKVNDAKKIKSCEKCNVPKSKL
jgi:primary-amine oxidase